ncbi:DUF2637 domain-containing protein [Streptomyces sp. NPDC001401]|uniref:DUF2637 domain-containing protein n=1 Tax=Streptomyces sp. NPDC001401 TaxID=3364570 RepID=UPI00369F4F6C
MRSVEAPRKDESRAADLETWVRRGCALVVASVAAYASYIHQRAFALQGGADAASAALWPLSVDGLLLLATVGLLKPARHAGRRARAVVWMAFLLGIGVSLAANVAAAPALAWQPVLVAGWPPVALLFSVELLAHRSSDRERTENGPREQASRLVPKPRPSALEAKRDGLTAPQRDSHRERESETSDSRSSSVVQPKAGQSAEEVMWDYFNRQQAVGHTPNGTELDRVAGTNNYGRAVLRQWRRTGRIPAAPEESMNRAISLSKSESSG